MLNFNSIKVQLKQKLLNSNVPLQPVFQFHKGTIKTRQEVLGIVKNFHLKSNLISKNVLAKKSLNYVFITIEQPKLIRNIRV